MPTLINSDSPSADILSVCGSFVMKKIIDMGVQLTYIMNQDRQIVKKDFFTNIASKAKYTLTSIHVHVSSLLRGVHSPDFAHC